MKVAQENYESFFYISFFQDFFLFFLFSLTAGRPDTTGHHSTDTYPAETPLYTYTYTVDDEESNNKYGATESRDGEDTEGSYYVSLPDGRLQKVSYRVNGEGGYVVSVSYNGEAQYPDESYSKPVSSYSQPEISYIVK